MLGDPSSDFSRSDHCMSPVNADLPFLWDLSGSRGKSGLIYHKYCVEPATTYLTSVSSRPQLHGTQITDDFTFELQKTFPFLISISFFPPPIYNSRHIPNFEMYGTNPVLLVFPLFFFFFKH